MRRFRVAALFVALLAFWLVLSGRTDPLFAVMGLASAALITWFGVRLLDEVVGSAEGHPPISIWHLVTYLLWLLARIPPAGMAIARVVIDPRRPPRPGVVRFRTALPSAAARTLLANSITLVPGTITLNVDGDELTVHAFTPDAVADLADAATQSRIAKVFRSPADRPPEMVWEPVHDELPEEDDI